LVFSFQFEDRIWKTAIEQQSGKLVLELRNDDELQISYVILDISREEKSAPFTVEGVDWWSSLLVVTKGYLFIEKYEDPQNPLDKSLIVAKMSDGEVIRNLPGHQLVEIKGQSILLQKIDDPTAVIEDQLPNVSPETGNHEFLEPMVFPAGSDNFATVQLFLSEEIVSQVEYLELKAVIISSYCLPSGKGLTRALLVLKEEKTFYQTTLDTEMEGAAPGAFFVLENFLIFIVERKQINAIKL
jgi:hypothetical protein